MPLFVKEACIMEENRFCTPLDALNVFGVYLGILNYDMNMKQSSNDDILKELKMQDEVFLKRCIEQNELIIKQNEEILQLLKEKRS